jgi:dihydroflavonol-4-reductase
MIFVTGGTGLVGSHLLLSLLQRGENVRALKRASSNLNQVLKTFQWYSGEAEKLYQQIEWVDGDMLDIYSLEPLLEGVETIYHCAAIVSFDSRQRMEMIISNVEGTANLVNAAIQNGVKRICHVSSVSALGRTVSGKPVNEETNWIPSKKNSSYSESKFFAETEIWRGVEEGLEAVIVNPTIIIGPGNWESGSTAFFRLINRGMRFYPGGSTGFVDVRDVTSIMLLLMEKENFESARNQRYLVNAENLSYREFFSMVAAALKKPAPSLYASPLLLKIAWRLGAIASFFTGRAAQITRETASSASSTNRFDGSKITSEFGFNYRPVAVAIENTAKNFLSAENSKSGIS